MPIHYRFIGRCCEGMSDFIRHGLGVGRWCKADAAGGGGGGGGGAHVGISCSQFESLVQMALSI